MQELGVTTHGLCQANAPQRRRAPIAATGFEFGTVVGQAFAHVVQQQVAVRADHLVGQLRFSGIGRRGERGFVATLATGLVEQVFAGQHLRRVDATARRHGEVTGIEQHQAQDIVADFRLAIGAIAVGGLFAGDLGIGAVIEGSQRGGEAHITRKRVNILLIEVGLPGLPAKTPEHGFLLGVVPDPIGAADDGFFVGGLRVGVAQDIGVADGFEQAQADHGRGDACGKTRIRMHRAVAELGDLQVRLAQLDYRAVLERHVDRCVVDSHLAFRQHARHGHVLQLPAVDRLGHHADLFDELGIGRCIRNRQAYQHRHRIRRVG
ncbi:hypothetical protein ES708_28181 [subsurface metagenome]